MASPRFGAAVVPVSALAGCEEGTQPAGCLLRLALPHGAGDLPVYVSQRPTSGGGPPAGDAPQTALIVLHGFGRNAAESFRAGLATLRGRPGEAGGLVVAPLFQVIDRQEQRCVTSGEIPAAAADARWSCGGWLAGAPSSGPRPITSFAAMDALIVSLKQQWPSLQRIALAGFSAGARFVQRYAAFAADAPAGVRLRYVVAAPGTWLYFDPQRPQASGQSRPTEAACAAAGVRSAQCRAAMILPDAAACPGFNRWKYGLDALPRWLPSSPARARARYRSADMAYLIGGLDSGAGAGAFDRRLDHSCAAQLQGSFRLQRAQGYLAYEREVLHPATARVLTVVPGCGHDVGCVLPSPAARDAIFKPHPGG